MAAAVKRPPAATRDEWFDRLARGAAKSMSRRDAVGFVAGTTAMAIVASWFRPSWAMSAGAAPVMDPGCNGTRTLYFAGCAKPVPKLNPKFPVNGCGPQNGFNPVPQTPLNLANFSPACDEHDIGYGTCNRPKEVTDTRFLFDMNMICVKAYPVTGFESALNLVACTRSAEIYYNAVSSKMGIDPYKDGQSNGCDCCDECPPLRQAPPAPCPTTCPGANTACCVQIKYGYHHGGCCRPGEECCIGPNGDTVHPNQMSWCCPKGRCGACCGKCMKSPCVAG